MKIQTKIEGFIIRDADKKDCGLILSFIKELADYEKLLTRLKLLRKLLLTFVFS